MHLELQRDVWLRAFKGVLRRNPAAEPLGLLASEPLFNFDEIRAGTQQVGKRRLGGTRRW